MGCQDFLLNKVVDIVLASVGYSSKCYCLYRLFKCLIIGAWWISIRRSLFLSKRLPVLWIIQITLSRPQSFYLNSSPKTEFNFAFFHSFQNIVRHVSYWSCARPEKFTSIIPEKKKVWKWTLRLLNLEDIGNYRHGILGGKISDQCTRYVNSLNPTPSPPQNTITSNHYTHTNICARHWAIIRHKKDKVVPFILWYFRLCFFILDLSSS